jgi:hypothetical protein
MRKTFVMIHGSWHGGWAWQEVVRHLLNKGHSTEAPTLPGHGPQAMRLGIAHHDCVRAVVVGAIVPRAQSGQFGQAVPEAVLLSFIRCRHDKALPPGYFRPRMSSRLGAYKLLEMDGSHEVMFTRPEELADKIVEASFD